MGTDGGKLHRCSTAYTSEYLTSYMGHDMAVYAVRWNTNHARTFVSASADWTVKLWDSNLEEVSLHACPSSRRKTACVYCLAGVAWAWSLILLQKHSVCPPLWGISNLWCQPFHLHN